MKCLIFIQIFLYNVEQLPRRAEEHPGRLCITSAPYVVGKIQQIAIMKNAFRMKLNIYMKRYGLENRSTNNKEG